MNDMTEPEAATHTFRWDLDKTYLRTDFDTPADPMLHARRILGLDGVNGEGKTKLKAADGRAVIVEDTKLLN